MNEDFEVIMYKTKNGVEPLNKFLNSLDSKMYAKFLMEYDLLKEYGNALPMPYSKPLEKGIFELRIQVSNNISRVLYFFMSGKKIVLTHGFIKKNTEDTI